MNCNAAPIWRFLCAMQLKMYKCWRPKNDERTTNVERRTNEWLVRIFAIGPNSDRLVRIPIDWSESRTIGPNSERLVRTIGPNSERLVRIPNEFRTNDEFDVGVFKNQKNCIICWIALLLRCGGSCVQSSWKCSSVGGWKKIGVDWPRPSRFRKKFLQRVNVQIEKSAWTGLGKSKKGLFSGKCL